MTSRSVFVVLISLALLLSCAQAPDEPAWDNPWDPEGTDYDVPTVAAMADTFVAIVDSFAVHAQGTVASGGITGYVWAVGGAGYLDTTTAGTLRVAFATAGVRVIRVKAIDDDGQESAPDSVRVTVQLYPPSVVAIRDTTVSFAQTTAVVLTSSASDPNGTVQKYYWDVGLDGWDDSTDAASWTVTTVAGGPVWVRWAARDDDGVMSVSDTFRVLFNRPPTGAAVTAPTQNTAWTAFSWTTGKGTLPLTLTGMDPDGATDTLTYTLELGPDAGSLAHVYSGRTPTFAAAGIDSGATVHWRLLVRDLYGDTVSSTGTFVAPPPPPPAGMVALAGGTFQMGSTAYSDEQPVHGVTVSPFWMDTTEVTQGRYASLMAATYAGYTSPSWTSYGTGANYPAYYVNWYDAALYCNARTKERGSTDTVYRYTSISGTPGNDCVLNGLTVDLSKKAFRLPTEAEWEYACRGGTTSTYYWGEATDAATVGTYAWYSSNSGSTTHPVATKQPNAFGLYDMSGNLWEWCNDWYGSYASGAVTDPTGAATGTYRVLRGGSWGSDGNDLRSANRGDSDPGVRDYGYGFRCILPRY